MTIPIETIMRRVGDLGITDSINIALSDKGWQVSIKRPRSSSYAIGIAAHMDEAFRRAVCPPWGTPMEEWLNLEGPDQDDWRDLI